MSSAFLTCDRSHMESNYVLEGESVSSLFAVVNAVDFGSQLIGSEPSVSTCLFVKVSHLVERVTITLIQGQVASLPMFSYLGLDSAIAKHWQICQYSDQKNRNFNVQLSRCKQGPPIIMFKVNSKQCTVHTQERMPKYAARKQHDQTSSHRKVRMNLQKLLQFTLCNY